MAIKWDLNMDGIRDIERQWADGDGEARAARVESAMRANAPVDSGELADSIVTIRETHPQGQPVFHIGADAPHALVIESQTGFMSRALDAGMGGS